MDPSHDHQYARMAYNGHPQGPPPPAHILNNYSNGNSPTTAGFQHPAYFGDGAYADDDTDERGGDHGQGDPKRRRIARACDMCRKKKIKCDGKMPKCSHCENYKTECIFTQVEKKRNPPKG